MASSLLLRVLCGSVLCALPAIWMAACLDYVPPASLTPDAATTATNPDGAPATTTTNPDGSTTTTPGVDAGPPPSGPETLVISEMRSHGAGGDGFGDDFIELYNTGNDPITLDANWVVHQQSAQGAPCQGLLTNFVGEGQVIPPHSHFLLGGWEYGKFDSTTPPADTPLLMSTVDFSLADASSIWVLHGTKVIDALCFYYNDDNKGYLGQTCGTPYVCEGTPVNNLPHDGSSQAASSVNTSLARKIANGALQDTGDNSADFQVIMPATPQDLKSPVGP